MSRALSTPRALGCVSGPSHAPAFALAAASLICTSACAPCPNPNPDDAFRVVFTSLALVLVPLPQTLTPTLTLTLTLIAPLAEGAALERYVDVAVVRDELHRLVQVRGRVRVRLGFAP